MKCLCALVLACSLASVAASAQEVVKAPVRVPGGVTPIFAPNLPVTPTIDASTLGNLLRKAAGAALGYGTRSVPGAQTSMVLNFAPTREGLSLPPLPGTAVGTLGGNTASVPLGGIGGMKAQTGQITGQQNGLSAKSPARSDVSGRALPGVIPVVFTYSVNMPAVGQSAERIAKKTEALRQPLETAVGLATNGTGKSGSESARRLGDGIWEVMTDQQTAGRGDASGLLRDAVGSPTNAPGESAHETGASRADLEALDYSALSSGPSAASLAARGAWGASGGTMFSQNGAGVTFTSGQEFLAEAVGAAESARRFARENLTQDEAAAAKKAASTFSKAGPIERVLLQSWDTVLKLFSVDDGTLKPGWSAEAGYARANYDARSVSNGTRLQTGGGVVVLQTEGSGANRRLVSQLAAKNGGTSSSSDSIPAVFNAPGFITPSAQSVPDALLGLSLLPLLAFALAYLREFRRE